MLYAWIKLIHVSTVVFTISFFSLRLFWMITAPGMIKKRWVRKLSAYNDTILLLAGIAMLVILRLNPFQVDWLTTKLVALLVYILLGMHALHFGKTKSSRLTSGVLALFTVGYMVLVALGRSPTPDILMILQRF
ncbi:MAG: SirB2 family protein [Chromatiales bacterium]|nr:SirB2 family protein [Chromatiales bacterium]